MYASNFHYFDTAVSWMRGSAPLRYVKHKMHRQCTVEYADLQGRDLDYERTPAFFYSYTCTELAAIVVDLTIRKRQIN